MNLRVSRHVNRLLFSAVIVAETISLTFRRKHVSEVRLYHLIQTQDKNENTHETYTK